LLAHIELLDGKPHGSYKEWSVGGTLTVHPHMKNGQYHGSYKSWWDNGQLKEEGTYDNGRRVGLYRWYKLDGEPAVRLAPRIRMPRGV
jgi:antitoxin component YwqK of YwqJK toxin-antitoxin module